MYIDCRFFNDFCRQFINYHIKYVKNISVICVIRVCRLKKRIPLISEDAFFALCSASGLFAGGPQRFLENAKKIPLIAKTERQREFLCFACSGLFIL